MNSKNACDYRTQNVAEIGAVNVKKLLIVHSTHIKTVTVKISIRMSNFAKLHLCNKVSFEYPKPLISFIVFANEYVTDRCHIQDISSRFMDIQCH